MCIKTIFHNTYIDGLNDITERVESCLPGYICPTPAIVEYDRDYNCPRDQAKASQARNDCLSGSPRSLSPLSRVTSGSDASASCASSASSASSSAEPARKERRKIRRSGVYVNGTKISSSCTSASAAPASSSHSSHSSHSAMPSATQPIPIRRAATMTYGGMEPPPERGRRPIIVEERVPSPSYMMPQPTSSMPRQRPVDIFEHTTTPSSPRRRNTPLRDFRDFRDFRDYRDLRDIRGDVRGDLHPAAGIDRTFSLRRRPSEREAAASSHTSHTSTPHHRRNSSSGDNFLHPYRARTRVDSSPQGYGSAEDDHERAERRRRRRLAHERASVMPSSVPTFGNANTNADAFGSSYESSYTFSPAASASASPSSATSSTSPAVYAVKKELRWKDEERRRQNERINMRPKLSRDDTAVPSGKLQGEVKSILKNTTTPTEKTEKTEKRSPRASSRASSGASPRAPSRASSRPPSSSSRRASFAGPVPDVDDIFSSGVSGLNIRGNSPPPEDGERTRLRNRFSMPPRRYTAGGSHRRRTEIWPPATDEDRFRY